MIDGPLLPSQAGWLALLPRHPATQPLPRFISCLYGTQRVISVLGWLSALIIPTRLMDGPWGNLGISPLLPCACPCQAPAAFPPFPPSKSQIMGFRVGTEGGSVRGGEAATILGTHLSALLCGQLGKVSMAPLPAREPGAGGGQCHQTASLETSPPNLLWKHLSPAMARFSFPISCHCHSYLLALVYSW